MRQARRLPGLLFLVGKLVGLRQFWLFLGLVFRLEGVSLFLASPRKSKQKEGDPRVGAGCAGPLRYSPLAGAAELGPTGLRQSSPSLRQQLRCSAPLRGTRKASRGRTPSSKQNATVGPKKGPKSKNRRSATDGLPGPLGGAEQRRLARKLALDQGTTSSRAILVFDAEGNEAAPAQKEFRQTSTRSPAGSSTIRSTCGRPAARWRKPRCGRPASPPAMSPPSASPTSARPRCCGNGPPAARWRQRHRLAGPAHRRGLRPPRAEGPKPLVRAEDRPGARPLLLGTKLAWLLDRAGARGARRKRGELAFGTVDSWLAWNLSGGRLHVTDPSNASRTLLFDIRSGDWDDELLALFGIPRAAAAARRPFQRRVRRDGAGARSAPACRSARRHGRRPAGGAVRPGLPRPGLAKNTYGTGCFLLMQHRRRPSPRNRLLPRSRGADGRCARATRWRAASSSAARWCSGCATASA
jgi:hypothetical protein